MGLSTFIIDDVSMQPPIVDEDEPTVAIPEGSDDDSDSGEEEEVCSNISKIVYSYCGSIYRKN